MSQKTSSRLLGLILLMSPVIIIGGLVIVVVTLVNDGPGEDRVPEAQQQPTPTLAREVAGRVGVSPADLKALGFDILPPVTMPGDNPLNDAKVELGKLLFFDPRMSANSTISCATCHQPRQGWGEGQDINFGFTNTPHWRNSQTVINSAHLPKLFWAGESLSLEKQAKSAWTGATAQNLDPDLAVERMRQIPEYVRLFTEAFGPGGPNFGDALRAVAAFESTINSTNVPFDTYLEGDTSALSDSALNGAELFVGKAGCSACHSGPLLTDQGFHALGVPDNPKFAQDPLRQVTLRFQTRARGVSEDVYRSASTDLGLFYTTKQEIDVGKFRTPMLREVGQTGPYMHNGVFATLEDVVQFYNAGGGSSPNKSPLLRPLGLDDQEVADLVAFLESLTGDAIIVEQPDLPDYEVLP